MGLTWICYQSLNHLLADTCNWTLKIASTLLWSTGMKKKDISISAISIVLSPAPFPRLGAGTQKTHVLHPGCSSRQGAARKPGGRRGQRMDRSDHHSQRKSTGVHSPCVPPIQGVWRGCIGAQTAKKLYKYRNNFSIDQFPHFSHRVFRSSWRSSLLSRNFHAFIIIRVV